MEYQFPMAKGEDPNDPGWESEVRAREEEVGRYEGRILAREFKQRLAYNLGLVCAHNIYVECGRLLTWGRLPLTYSTYHLHAHQSLKAAEVGQPSPFPMCSPDSHGSWA